MTKTELKKINIQISGVSYKYPNAIQALHDLSFSIQQGDCVVILGPNGSGKSTLLLHLNGILLPEHGEVFVNGLSTKHEKNHVTVRSQVGLVFQDPNNQLFMPTVIDDVAFGPLNQGYSITEARKKAEHALKMVDLSDIKHRNPAMLSVGEKKRVAIAGILVMDPPIIAFDEPIVNLDPFSAEHVINIIINMKKRGHTIIIATHDMLLAAELATRVIVLDKGILIANDTPEKVLTNNTLLDSIGMQPPMTIEIAKKIGLSQPFPLTRKALLNRIPKQAHD